MKFVVIGAAALLAIAVVFAARGLPVFDHPTTASSPAHVAAHDAGTVTTAKQAIADVAASGRVFQGIDVTNTQGVTANYVSTQ